MDFIFMLTHRDCTVEDPLEVLDQASGLGLRHIGFKDIGAPSQLVSKVVDRIRAMEAISYMEVVSTDPAESLRSAKLARDLGVDRLLGGTQVDEILSILSGSRTAYFPFAGQPIGHPTRLESSPVEIERHCRALMARGCPGVDLLAYRATEANPLELVAAARRGLGDGGYLIVAGSIDSPDQIRALGKAGVDAFTIGSAVFDRSFRPEADSIRDQLYAILKECATLGS